MRSWGIVYAKRKAIRKVTGGEKAQSACFPGNSSRVVRSPGEIGPETYGEHFFTERISKLPDLHLLCEMTVDRDREEMEESPETLALFAETEARRVKYSGNSLCAKNLAVFRNVPLPGDGNILHVRFLQKGSNFPSSSKKEHYLGIFFWKSLETTFSKFTCLHTFEEILKFSNLRYSLIMKLQCIKTDVGKHSQSHSFNTLNLNRTSEDSNFQDTHF